jgi:hypothetical protein
MHKLIWRAALGAFALASIPSPLLAAEVRFERLTIGGCTV